MLALFAIWVLISGLDDLFLDLAFLGRWLMLTLAGPRARAPTAAELRHGPQRRIAVFAPLWREHNVIRHMIEHNLVATRYGRYDFFVGAYPNDDATLSAVRELETRFPGVHLSLCPHAGPTSKADNLNWIFESMLEFELLNGARFEIVVTHDAEDLMHPEELGWINYHIRNFDMVQIP